MMKYQSHAVTAQRIEPKDSPDDFPTPPWATRALIEHVIDKSSLASMSCLEPACGAGHMAKVLKEYFKEVRCADAFHYGYAPVRDFLTHPYETNAVDWVITNPPFRLAEEFVARAFQTPFDHRNPLNELGEFGRQGDDSHKLRLVRLGKAGAQRTPPDVGPALPART